MYLPTIHPKDDSGRKRFVIGVCVPLVTAFLYWPILLLQAPSWSEGMVWLKNNPALSVFQLVLLPIISGILFAGIKREHVRGLLNKNKTFSIVLLIILLLMGVARVVQDSFEALSDRVIEPLEFRSGSDRVLFAAEHSALRKKVADKVQDICPELSTEAKPIQTASECYREFTRQHFKDDSITLISHGGIVSWWQRLLSLQAAILVMFLVWYLLSSGFARSRPPKATFEAIILCLAMSATWFPLRLYSEWFVNFRSLGTLSSNQSLFIVGALLLITLGAAFLLRSSKPSVSILAAILSGLSVVCGIIAKFSPETFGTGANVFEGINPVAFVSVEIILFLFLLSILRFKAD